MKSDYQMSLLTRDAELAALDAEWTELETRSRIRNPFLGATWTRLCREYHCPEAMPFVLTARRRGRLVGVAALRREQRFGLRVLRFLGDGRSDYLGFLTDAAVSEAEAVLLWELVRRRSEWDLAMLRQLTPDYSGLIDCRAPDRLRDGGVEATVAPYLAHDGDWDSLLEAGPGWLKRMRKTARKFEKEGGRVERLLGDEAAARVMEVAEVEAASWKWEQGVARFQAGAGQDLLRAALAALGPRGEMELWLAHKDDRPVAFEVNFLSPERIWLYQGAYRSDYRKYSPGGVLDFLSIQRAWEAGAREYDFLSGDEAYKFERTTATRSIHYRAFYPNTWRGLAAWGCLAAPRWKLIRSAPAKAALQVWTQARGHWLGERANGDHSREE